MRLEISLARLLKPCHCMLLLFCSISAYAQRDSLILKNWDIIVGELKSLSKGVVTIETDYSKNDFNIEWDGLKEIYSDSRFLITVKNGSRLNGTFHSIEGGKRRPNSQFQFFQKHVLNFAINIPFNNLKI